MRRELGRLLARLRTAAGYTQVVFAQRAGSTRSSIKNIEAGRQGVSRAAWERFDVLLGADGALAAAFDELSTVQTEWERAGQVIDLVEDTFGLGARVHSGETVSDVRDAALQWLISTHPHMSATASDQRRVGLVDVAVLQQARDRFKAVDNQHGGAAAFPLMADCVRQQVRPLLRGRYKDAVGDPLFRTAAQLVLDAGWAAYDADSQSYARRCMRAALRLADMAGDRLFGGRVLAALAHQSLHVGRNQEAVDLATAALHGAGRIAGPQAVAMFEAMLACGAATMGDRRACEAALSRAECALDRADSQSEVPGWLDFDRGGLVGHAARAYRDLGDTSRARQFAEHAVDLCRDGHVRTQVQRKAILATALAGAGETDHACAIGQDLLTQARPLRSALVLSDLRKLTGLLGSTGICGEFRQQVRLLNPARLRPLPR